MFGYVSGSSLYADAARFKLLEADTGQEANYSYVHVDQFGAPVALSNKNGSVVWTATYDPYGTAAVNDDPDQDGVHRELNLRLPGQYCDAETGLSYNFFRGYDPSIGRYLESDPVGLRGGINTYVYASNNPVSTPIRSGLKAVQAMRQATIR